MVKSLFNSREIITLVILLALSAGICGYVYHKEGEKPPPYTDSYEQTAFTLAQTGIYSDQYKDVDPAPRVGRAPGYPAFAALFIILDKDYRNALKCFYTSDKGKRAHCTMSARMLYFAQGVLYVVLALCLYLVALLFGAGRISAVFFPLMGLYFCADLGVHHRMSEGIALPLFAIASWLLTLHFAGRTKRHHYLFLGAALALLALTRVAYAYMIPVIAASMIFVPAKGSSRHYKLRLKQVVFVCLVSGALMTPWLYRSYQLTGKAQIATSGIAGVLVMRNQYNQMSFQDALTGLVYWIPGFGDSLARRIFPEERWQKFDMGHDKSFRNQGWRQLAQLRDEGYSNAEIKKLMIQQVKAQPVKHALVSIPLLWRGSKYVFPVMPFILGGLVLALCRKQWWILASLTPAWFNLLFHAGFTHFHHRYGLPLIIGGYPLSAYFISASYKWLKDQALARSQA